MIQRLTLISSQDLSYYAEGIPKQTTDQVNKFIQDFLAYVKEKNIQIDPSIFVQISTASYINMLSDIYINDKNQGTRNA